MTAKLHIARGEGASAPAPESASASAPSPSIALAKVAATGDVHATAALLRDVGPRMASAARAVLGAGHPDLDDVVQQSLITLVHALPGFRGECEPSRYAGRIAVRIAVHARRRARAHAARSEHVDDADANDTGRLAKELVGTEPSPHDAVSSSRRVDLIRELLETIPEEQAECLALRVVLGFSLEEVAITCGVPLNTVRSRVRLAKEALRRRIEADPRLSEELEGAS